MAYRNLAIGIVAGLLVFALSGCSAAAPSQSSSASTANSTRSEAVAVEKDFDGSDYSDTGAGTMNIRTAAGTSENGNIPELATKNVMATQIDIEIRGMDGVVCDVYVDGMENGNVTAGDFYQGTITLQGEALADGVHTVELVRMDGDTPAIYKKAQYKAVA